MSPRTWRALGTLALGGAVLPLVGAGAAFANDLDQAARSGQATAENAQASFVDALDGKRPEGADGLESEFVEPDPRFVESPLGGLMKNGPFE